ncbi:MULTISPECIES: hypothetical protein [Dehalobacter]|jgi:hypothetical protein|uniref:Uncharacterized protein n=2 Tax=Dehalobacter restrictus TaxID=55583 RepID=A0A857DG50_9FIRM|nr:MULTISPECIES: hypothetical protein [Dehalobacter]AHF11280.1 hypothetical protein DEHRE_03865 [Dehalobacter restrictus DSM 9455]MCG1025213.1 hypothetical protein [Dehalobacter sp.]MDJ0305803.1 hypothetical protein [Dehalobacter sp.]OCZ52255.1 hypothetical protein A7D23_10715 [Dehalobacter sp. TeCB1]QGZ99866.1 hypothetical protein GQ588_04010 [Dehalobacter restrictus]
MNTAINPEFIQKMLEAKRLQKEALETLMPENVRHHLSVIEKEVKDLLLEYLMDGSETSKNTDQPETHSNVHSVTIN